MRRMQALAMLLLALAAGALSGCGTTRATVATSRGEQLMLLGHDPVAYFSEGRAVRGRHTLAASHEGRTYYFATPENRAAFATSPARYEPQYGGFCASGAAYGVKLGADPTEFEVRGGRLFIFGDVLGHEFWKLDERRNIERADALWPKVDDVGWRAASLHHWIFKVPWYRTGRELMAEWRARNPGRTLSYDPGGMMQNLVLEEPGWRARKGFGQPRLGVPGEPDDPLAR